MKAGHLRITRQGLVKVSLVVLLFGIGVAAAVAQRAPTALFESPLGADGPAPAAPSIEAAGYDLAPGCGSPSGLPERTEVRDAAVGAAPTETAAPAASPGAQGQPAPDGHPPANLAPATPRPAPPGEQGADVPPADGAVVPPHDWGAGDTECPGRP